MPEIIIFFFFVIIHAQNLNIRKEKMFLLECESVYKVRLTFLLLTFCRINGLRFSLHGLQQREHL